MGKIIPKEIVEEPVDLKYEYSRAIKTFCIILIIFLLGFWLKVEYNNLLANSRFLKFYPEKTLYYEDFLDAKDFNAVKLNEEFLSLSYGVFKDDRGNDKFLIVGKTDKENTPIVDGKKYSYFISNGYEFISNSDEELIKLNKRLEVNNYEFIKHKNIKKVVKNLDKKRDATIIVDNSAYANLKTSREVEKAMDRLFDKAVIQVFKADDGLTFTGEISFNNELAGVAVNLKRLSECFNNRNIKIENFKSDKVAVIIAVKDFDLWTQSILNVTKNLPANQYSETFKLIQNIFNSDVENDIVKKLNGNAVFYLFNEKRELHPMLLVETKQDIASQAQKYFSFLQVSNGLKFSESELNKKSFNTLSSKFYPHNLSFGTIDDSVFLLGHQSIIENFVEAENKAVTQKNSDFYFYANIDKTPLLKKNKGFWKGYKTMEVELSLTPHLSFSGKMTK